MFRPTPLSLSFHAAIIILLGMFVGFPYGSRIVAQAAEETLRAWRLAHLEGLMNGLLMLAVVAIWHHMKLSKLAGSALWWCLVLGGYANIVAPIIAAMTGYRGLEPTGPFENWLVFGIFQFALLLFPAGLLVAFGLGKQLRHTATEPQT
jgi:hypothetical protein